MSGDDSPLEQRLVQTALDALDHEPAERLSMRHVALAVGVSHQAPYVHFGSKRRFLAAVAGAGLQEAAEAAAQALDSAGKDALGRLHALIDAYVDFIRNRPHVHDLAYGALVAKADHPDLQRAAASYWDLLHDTVAACQPPKTEEAEVLRRSVAAWGLVYGIARLDRLDQIPKSVPGDHREVIHEAVARLHEGWQANNTH